MTSRLDDRIRSLMRPSENLRVVLDVELASDHHHSDGVSLQSDASRQRVISIITHENEDLGCEEGGFLVLKSDERNGGHKVERAFPITQGSTLVLAQSRQTTLESWPSDIPSNSQPQGAFVLTIGGDTQENTLSFVSRDIQRLQRLSAEYRRVREIGLAWKRNSADYAWLQAYLNVQPCYQRFQTTDLRVRNTPLHDRLSPAVAGLPSDDELDIEMVRHEWIAKTAADSASNGSMKRLSIRLGSFNVNGKTPSQDLSPWILGRRKETLSWISPLQPIAPLEVPSDHFVEDPSHNDEARPLTEEPIGASSVTGQESSDPDILVIGFQELDLSKEALLYATSTTKEDAWLLAIFAALGEKGMLYEKLASRQLVGMLLVVIVKKVLSPCFSNIKTCDAGAGFMGFMGNKGATAVRLEFTPKSSPGSAVTACRPTVFTFVNTHLAAYEEMTDRRNYDFHDLSGRLLFSSAGPDRNYAPSVSYNTYDIYQSDLLFWMVYLNYRLDLPDGDIRALLSSHVAGINSIPLMLVYDQLKCAIHAKRAFVGFKEFTITHMPTYRYASGTSKDILGYDTKRKPAWTDRVLYMCHPGIHVDQLTYRSHSEITMSDHQPISADFVVSVPMIDNVKYEGCFSELERKLSNLEKSGPTPRIKSHTVAIDLGQLAYRHCVRRELIVQNDGDIPCVYRFVGTVDGPILPSWLCVEPMVSLLPPREAMTITVLGYVDNDTASKLNGGPSRLEHTLILHTALGRDHFIPVTGEYLYTCFANTVKRLTQLPGPIRMMKSPEEIGDAKQAVNAPREIMRLINWMMTNVSDVDALFECPAKESLCTAIRECLDTGDDFPTCTDKDHRTFSAAFASTLVSFLDSLTEPLVPSYLHSRCLQANNREEAFEVLDEFPQENINVWISLTAFLHYISQKHCADCAAPVPPSGPSKAHRLAMIFAPILLRDDPSGVLLKISPIAKRDFLLHFIA